MKKLLSMILSVCIVASVLCFNVQADEQFTKTPAEMASEIVAGWNLGNTLDSCQSWGNIPSNPTVTQQETGWNNPVTTIDMINKVKNAGFNAVRVPVTWYLQVTEDNGTYTVNSNWMSRVKQVVDYCISNNMYVILDMHHDDQYWLNISSSESQWLTIKEKYQQLWQQIATTFKDYDEKLILEGANEMTATCVYDGCGTTGKCWWGHTQKVFDRVNEINQIFVDTVRASGGNNDVRYLMIPTYGALRDENQIKYLTIPNNDNHILIDVHWYETTTSANTYESRFSMLSSYATKYNAGLVMGECGLTMEQSDSLKVAWANSFVKIARKYNIPCFLWDDGGSYKILNRNSLDWTSEQYVNAVVNAGYTLQGNCGTNATYSFSKTSGELVISGSGAMANYSIESPAPWLKYADYIKIITINDSITSIGNYAFYNLSSADKLTIAESIKSIGDYAFSECRSLTLAELPDLITTIGEGAFYDCTNLAKITLPSKLKNINNMLFYNCTSLNDVTLPETVTTVMQSSFYNCTALTEIAFPYSVTSIQAFAFQNCSSLETATFYNSKTTIVNTAFYSCNKLDVKCFTNSTAYSFAVNGYIDYEFISAPSTAVSIPTTLSMKRGKTYQLSPTFTPAYSTDTVTYSTFSKSIATVSSKGVITAVGKGYTYIVVKSSSGAAAKCKVTVSIDTSKITLSKTSYTMHTGKTLRLKYSYAPSDTQDSFAWSTSNKSVATVSSSGLVKGIKAGTATITIKASNGVKATCKVKIYKLKISATSKKLKVNKKLTLKTSGAKIAKWYSSNNKIATVTSSGKVTAKKKGVCYIYAKDIYGIKVKCKLSVVK